MEKRGKKAQAQIITTVLLILIAIGAIAVVSVFIFNLVSENLGGTECFKTVAEFEIKSGDEGATCYDATLSQVLVTVQRGQNAEFNLTDLSITVGDVESSTTFSYADDIDAGDLPAPGEKRTYTLAVTGGVDSVTVTPIIGKGKACEEGKSEKDVSACD